MIQPFQYLEALIAASKSVSVANAAYDAACRGLHLAIANNHDEYDVAAMLGDPYPDAVYEAMEALEQASTSTARANFEHAHASAAATSYIEAGVRQ